MMSLCLLELGCHISWRGVNTMRTKMNKVSIVIPIYSNWNLTHQILFDLYKYCTNIHEVVIVNDNSPDPEVITGLDWWMGNRILPVREIRLSKNVMFLKASNIGLKDATGDVIITVSNDVRIQSDIVTRISELLAKGNPNRLIGGRLLDFDTGWNTFNGITFPYLEGWLLATRKIGWEELGYFDEQFSPSDMEDVDISTNAKSLGYELISLNDDRIQHIGAQSIHYGPERERITLINKKKFEEKWLGKERQ